MNYKLKGLIACLIFVSMIFSGAFGLGKDIKAIAENPFKSKGIKMADYSMRFADYQHRSFINSPLSIKGEISCIDKKGPEESWPLLLLSSGNHLYVQYTDNVKCLTEDGKMVFEKNSSPGFDIVLTPKGIITRESGGPVVGYSTGGQKLFSKRIYTGTPRSFLMLACPVDDHLTLAQTFKREQKSPGEKGGSSTTTLLTMKGERLGWVQESPGRMPTAVITEDLKSVIWAKAPFSCCTYEIQTGDLKHSFDLKNRSIIAMSLGHKGDIIAACVSTSGRPSLLCSTLDGAEKWNCEFENKNWSDNPYPPVVDNQDQIWVIIGTSLYLVVNGEAKEICFVPDSDAQFITAFNNNRIAVAADSMIVVIDSNGQEVFKGFLPLDINSTTPPITIGTTGALYLGTEAGIYRVK
jgi:hypothetical protein